MERIRNLSHHLSLLIALGALLFTATAGVAQDWKGRARITGTVTDEAGQPIPTATITLQLNGEEGRGPAPIQVNKKGKWSYLGLTGGPWTVIIEAPGYDVSEGVMPVSQAAANKPLLKSLKKAGSSAAAGDPAAAAAAAAAAEASSKLSEAGSLIDAGDLAGGRAVLNEVVGTLDTGRQAPIYLAIAQTYLQEENVADAIMTMQKGLEVDPNHGETLSLISTILVNEGRADEAQVYMDRMPEGVKIDPTALLNQGIEKYNAGDIDGALAQFEAVVADYPDYAEGIYYRGLCYLNKGNMEGAKGDFTKFLEIAPDHAKAAEAKEFLSYL